MTTETTAEATQAAARPWEWLALAVALLALAGSLFMSVGMKLKACPLCIYERTFMMGLVGILCLGLLLRRTAEPGFLVFLSLPLAVGGLGVAAFHVYLELANILECPSGVLGLGTAPQQSLGAYLLVTALLALALVRSPAGCT